MTNVQDIYAAGDCAESTNLITGKPAWVPLGSTANKMGRILAVNKYGGCSDRLDGVLCTMIVKVFDISAAKTGLTENRPLKKAMILNCCCSRK